jgi:hypothetical protein
VVLQVYPTGLETSLNSALITGQQTVIVQQPDLTESLFQQLSLFSNYFGHTYFGVFSSGKTFQETPIWGDFFSLTHHSITQAISHLDSLLLLQGLF